MGSTSSSLQHVKNSIFYHIHHRGSHDEQWLPGHEIEFRKERINTYNSYYLNYDYPIMFNDARYTLPEIVNALKNGAPFFYNDIQNFLKLPHELAQVADDLITCIREEIFENIRQKEFPQCLSRKNCPRTIFTPRAIRHLLF
ncbi:hypothetical protein [Pyramidobacter piscolens]|uniref:hypothetical protein n=1 Tax=Pyramidobacter piscolens TaxID=638849 RepID=UPI0012EA2816|nr:hypothetical protein [Pyramidobacter piscolens]